MRRSSRIPYKDEVAGSSPVPPTRSAVPHRINSVMLPQVQKLSCNQRVHNMKLSNAIPKLCLAREADQLSPDTIKAYQWGLKKLVTFTNDSDLESITRSDLQQWLSGLRSSGLSQASIKVAWRGMRALFGWAAESEIIKNRPDDRIKAPVVSLPEVEPFTEDEVSRILDVCDFTKAAKTNGRKPFQMNRPTSKRDRALVLFLLDTGLRVSEVARLTVSNIRMDSGEAHILPYLSGLKSKPRTVYFGRATGRAIASYLNIRDLPYPDDPLFLTAANRPMDRNSIRKILNGMGERAGVNNVYPHRFRHTFAIQYLRNGGDIFTLQRLLGHSSLHMVKYYLSIASADVKNAHRKSSPVDRWRL